MPNVRSRRDGLTILLRPGTPFINHIPIAQQTKLHLR